MFDRVHLLFLFPGLEVRGAAALLPVIISEATRIRKPPLLRVGSSSRGSGCRAEREALGKGEPIRGKKLKGRSGGRHGHSQLGGWATWKWNVGKNSNGETQREHDCCLRWSACSLWSLSEMQLVMVIPVVVTLWLAVSLRQESELGLYGLNVAGQQLRLSRLSGTAKLNGIGKPRLAVRPPCWVHVELCRDECCSHDTWMISLVSPAGTSRTQGRKGMFPLWIFSHPAWQMSVWFIRCVNLHIRQEASVVGARTLAMFTGAASHDTDFYTPHLSKKVDRWRTVMSKLTHSCDSFFKTLSVG